MKKDFNSVRPSGSKKNEPKVIGEVLSEYFQSNEPLAVVFCSRQAKGEATADEEKVDDDRLFRDFFPDTHLCVDLKVISRKPGRMHVGEYINCLLTRDSEYHFSAVETASEMKKKAVRNPHLFRGKCINVVRKDNALYLTFNRPAFTAEFTFTDFCREAAEELQVVAGLVEEE